LEAAQITLSRSMNWENKAYYPTRIARLGVQASLT
jgi:hypothetical protein